MTYKIYLHNPPHYFVPKGKYFITGSTYKKQKYLRTPGSKKQFLSSMQHACKDYHWKLEDWVVLDNHYHLMLNAPENAETLSNLIKDLHRFSALWIKKNFKTPVNSNIWYNYWDTCIDYETSYYARLHYIWFNPVKHNYVKNAEDWEFGSYKFRLQNHLEETRQIIRKYPCNKVKIIDEF